MLKSFYFYLMGPHGKNHFFMRTRVYTYFWIDLFRLYILFSQYRSCDDTQEIWSFVLLIKKSTCKHIHACLLFLMNKTKDQISWVSSHDLYWENKMYKRKRSIDVMN